MLSGNKCAFPDCDLPLVDPETGVLTAEVCHIRGRNGPRHAPTSADEEVHDFDNLILLCPIHHKIIDRETTTYTVNRLREIKQSHLVNITAQLRQNCARQVQRARIPYSSFPVGNHTRYFTGRDQILEEIREALHPVSTGKSIILSGLGGVGKTQVAQEYAMRNEASYRHVFWIRGNVDPYSDFMSIARTLQLPVASTDEVIPVVLHWMGSNVEWLAIYDDVTSSATIQETLPTTSSGHVLITTRLASLDGIGSAARINVPLLSADASQEFLLNRTGRTSETEVDRAEQSAIIQLADELDGLPLALEQAAAYLVATKVSFSTYLNGYKRRRAELLELHGPVAGSYPMTIKTTWSINFDDVLSNRNSYDAFCLAAFYNAESIPFEILPGASDELARRFDRLGDNFDELELLTREVLMPLEKYSLIQVSFFAEVFSVHRIVQQVFLDRLSDEQRKGFALRSVKTLSSLFHTFDGFLQILCQRLLPHVEVCAKTIDQFDFIDDSACHLMERLGSFHTDAGHYVCGEKRLLEALDRTRRAHSDRSCQVALCKHSLGGAYIVMGRMLEAEPLLVEAIQTWEEMGIPSNENRLAVARANLATLYVESGRYETALPLLHAQLEAARSVSIEDHSPLIHVCLNLARLQRSMGQYKLAGCNSILRVKLGRLDWQVKGQSRRIYGILSVW